MGINAGVYHVSYEFVHTLEVNFAPIFLVYFIILENLQIFLLNQ